VLPRHARVELYQGTLVCSTNRGFHPRRGGAGGLLSLPLAVALSSPATIASSEVSRALASWYNVATDGFALPSSTCRMS